MPSSFIGGEMGFGTTPRVTVHITRRDVPRAAAARVPRAAPGSTTRATLAIPNTLVVELTDIRGLYKPGHVPAGVTHPRRSERLPGYLSEDHKGRIFLNRDLDNNYARDQQQIEITARVSVVRGMLPASAKIKWTVTDPDDTFDADPSVHRESAPVVDPGDHDASGAPTGALPRDNRGTFDHSPRWEEVSGFPIDITDDAEAKTDIVSGESKVLIHCPNTAGDDLLVTATIDSSVPVEVFGASTGVMTVWHRVDVEYVKMPSALDLPVDQVPPFFEEACAELSFSAPTVVKKNTPFMHLSGPSRDASFSQYIDNNAVHARDPGWFVVVAAMEGERPASTRDSRVILNSRVRLRDNISYTGSAVGAHAYLLKEFFTVRGDFSNAIAATFLWDGKEARFLIMAPVVMELNGETYTRLWIWPNDHTAQIDSPDGSLDQAYLHQKFYSPRYHHDGAAWVPGGYGMPDRVRVKLLSAGASSLQGNSPPLPGARGDYFCGRTVVFTHHTTFRDPETGHRTPDYDSEGVRIISHELVHAFGMPHRCGYLDHRAPRRRTCRMNYTFDWMLDPADHTRVIPGFTDRIGPHLCPLHLLRVRTVHLEDNDALHTVGW
ncbi:MAG: hypothetical protein R3F14_38725 [Polyangiaceae bacterium]